MELKNIYDGWKNTLIKDEEIEEMSKDRLFICNGCIEKTNLFNIDICGVCHCPLVAASRSPEHKCPKGYWNK